MLKEFRKDLGGAPDVKVPFKTPEQAGYTVIKVLASGGQGEAKLVTNSNGEKVVLKTYDKRNQNAGGLEDLKAEMLSMKQVEECVQIASCYEIFQDQGFYYMISGANFGGDFSSLMKKAKEAHVRTTEAWFRNIFNQAFSGLAYMHQNAMMHCDIKEPNLMLRTTDYDDPEVVIIDLGLAQLSADQDAVGACGTPGYIPPETWEQGIWFPRGDIFSMGVVCLQLLTDKVPNEKTGKMGAFTEGATSMDDVQRFTAARQPDYTKVKKLYPAIMNWLPQCLDKSRSQRLKGPQLLEKPWFKMDAESDKHGDVCAVQ